MGWRADGIERTGELSAMAETRTILICIFSGRPGNSAGKHVKVLYNTGAMKEADLSRVEAVRAGSGTARNTVKTKS